MWLKDLNLSHLVTWIHQGKEDRRARLLELNGFRIELRSLNKLQEEVRQALPQACRMKIR